MDGELAVLLNRNARGVTPRVVSTIRERLPDQDLFVSGSEDEAEDITREIMARGYPTVVTGGGDGTLQTFLNDSFECVGAAPHDATPASYPSIGVLKLGTGNAIGAYVGAEHYLPDLERIKAGAAHRPLTLIEADGQLCYFGGFGLDAAIINDLNEIKGRWVGRRLGYLASIPGLSLPRSLTTRRRLPEGRIVNLGREAFRIGEGGEPVGEPVGPGETLYEGRIWIAGVSTVPYYGYRFKLYPFADRWPGRMQLRVSDGGPIHTLAHLPAIWRGTYRSPRTRDFYCDRVAVELDRPAPFQLGGESGGAREAVELAVSRRSVDLLDLKAPAGVTLH